MDTNFCTDVHKQIFDAIARGKQDFVFWGFNENCIGVLSQLKELGLLESHTSGIIDSTPAKQGKRIFNYEILPPKKIVDLKVDVLVITDNAMKEAILRVWLAPKSRPRIAKIKVDF